ncbi:TauD/TfdA family dioxygenase [Acidovorax sp. Be4]|uniref:TauD/TfdA family dioxygenase n=1 Tax=Acidovorax bellezanensis TaxID=2976702 RepID=A0ABT2PJG3_9BURK|nr:TauD/TfdA family dioxygenase [Acidovorax sp. Be4]MCT9810625.1 TauD/TfdA family dioxygenase [Acidovorax sp. Be4]
MTLKITPLTGSVGAAVEGISLAEPLSSEQFEQLREAFQRHCVLVLRDQHLAPAPQLAFARRWGEPMVSALLSKLQLETYPEVIQVRTTSKELVSTEAWHYDAPHTPVPPKITMLSAQVVPAGGDTMWSNQYLAYEGLSPVMQGMLEGLRVHFRAVKLARSQGVTDSDLPSAVHPLVRTHPETGRKALYIGHADNVVGIEGMREAESRPLLNFLYQHSTQPDNIYRHMWRAGDVVMWDNRCTMHYAVHDYGTQERLLNRVTLKGEVPA